MYYISVIFTMARRATFLRLAPPQPRGCITCVILGYGQCISRGVLPGSSSSILDTRCTCVTLSLPWSGNVRPNCTLPTFARTGRPTTKHLLQAPGHLLHECLQRARLVSGRPCPSCDGFPAYSNNARALEVRLRTAGENLSRIFCCSCKYDMSIGRLWSTITV